MGLRTRIIPRNRIIRIRDEAHAKHLLQTHRPDLPESERESMARDLVEERAFLVRDRDYDLLDAYEPPHDPIEPVIPPAPEPIPADTFLEVVLVDDADTPLTADYELEIDNAPHRGQFPGVAHQEPVDREADCYIRLTALDLAPRERKLG